MLFVFGRSISPSLSNYFSSRASEDGHQVEFASMGEFADGEPFAELKFDPKDKICVIFQSIANAGGFNPSSHFMQMLACADNLKRGEAKAVWAMNPLAGFMRQDKLRPDRQESLLSDLSGKLMHVSGINGMSTVEAHSIQAIQNYEHGLGAGNVSDINPNAIFASAIERLGLDITSVANPDLGADARAEDLAGRLGLERISIEKNRHRDGTEITGQSGVIAEKTAMIDDMASSLGTAKNAIELLYDQGSKHNILLISHAIMTGNAWNNLAKLIKETKLDRVLFLPTLARDEEFVRFKQQYGPDVAEKITFLDDEFNDMIYQHVTKDVMAHIERMEL